VPTGSAHLASRLDRDFTTAAYIPLDQRVHRFVHPTTKNVFLDAAPAGLSEDLCRHERKGSPCLRLREAGPRRA